MAGMLGLVGPLMGIGSGIAGMMNGSPADNVQLPQQWRMPGMDQAAGGAMGGINQLLGMNVPQQLLPQYQGVAQNLMNNPFQGGAMGGALGASGYGASAAGQAANTGNYLQQMGSGVTPYAMGVMNMGFDPNRDTYNRQAFNTQQGARAGNEARGLGMTPWGAGVENEAMNRFNQDWQNNMLGRAATGAQAGGSLLGQGGSLMGAGVNMSAMAPGLMQNAGMFPYQTFNQIGGDQLGALNSLSTAGMNATQIPQQGVQNYLNYIGTGNNAGGVANQTAGLGLNQAQLGFNQNQVMGQNIGQGFAGLQRGMNNMGWGGSSGGGSSGGGSSGGGSSWFPGGGGSSNASLYA